MNRFIRQAAMALALVGSSLGCDLRPGGSLPVYSFDQTDSSRAGYRRTTITSAGTVFVHDFEEYSLRLANPDPTQVVGRSKFGNGKICAIEGQSPTAYLAADMGSEMPAYEVFRAERQPPFDWRKATFQKMRLAVPEGPVANKLTTDPVVIQDVVLTLRDGTPAAPFTVETMELPATSILCGSGAINCRDWSFLPRCTSIRPVGSTWPRPSARSSCMARVSRFERTGFPRARPSRSGRRPEIDEAALGRRSSVPRRGDQPSTRRQSVTSV